MNELLEQIKYNNGEFPEQQLIEIIDHKDEFTPELLQVLRNTRDNYKEILEEPNYFVHIYASYLLAQFKEKQSLSLIIDLVSLPGEIPFDIFGDVITDSLYRILASVCDGNTGPIKKLLENESVNEYVRSAGIRSFLILLAEGIISKNEVIEYYKSLFEGKLERKCSNVWNSLVNCCCKICPNELYEDIKKAYDDELVEDFYISLDNVDESLKLDDDKRVLNLKRDGYGFVKDTISDLKCWACFHENDDKLKLQTLKNNKKTLDKKKKKRKQAKASKKKQRKK